MDGTDDGAVDGGEVVGGAVDGGVDGPATGARSPAGVAGGLVPGGDELSGVLAGVLRAGALEALGVVEPGTVLLEPSAGPVTHCSTGRNVTMPVTSSGVESLALVPHARQVDDDGVALDAHVGLGDPEVLHSLADKVATTIRSSSVAPSVGDVTTETPPCRSSPRTGLLLSARFRASSR